MTKHTLITTLLAVITLLIVVLAGFILKGQSILSDIANIAQIVEGVVAVVLLLIAADIRESVKARHLEGIRYVKGLIGSTEASETRRWIYEKLRKAQWPLSDEDGKKALAVCRDFDHIGYICRNGLVPVSLVVETYNRNIVDMWNRLERFVVQWRQQRQDEDYFWEFEWLAHKAEVEKIRLDKKRQQSLKVAR